MNGNEENLEEIALEGSLNQEKKIFQEKLNQSQITKCTKSSNMFIYNLYKLIMKNENSLINNFYFSLSE